MITRIECNQNTCPAPGDALIVKKKGSGERRIPPNRWWVNRNTPVGDDAELYEIMPHHGRRMIAWDALVAVERIQGGVA